MWRQAGRKEGERDGELGSMGEAGEGVREGEREMGGMGKARRKGSRGRDGEGGWKEGREGGWELGREERRERGMGKGWREEKGERKKQIISIIVLLQKFQSQRDMWAFPWQPVHLHSCQ